VPYQKISLKKQEIVLYGTNIFIRKLKGAADSFVSSPFFGSWQRVVSPRKNIREEIV